MPKSSPDVLGLSSGGVPPAGLDETEEVPPGDCVADAAGIPAGDCSLGMWGATGYAVGVFPYVGGTTFRRDGECQLE